jgi:carboxypeptidase Q
MPRYFRVPVRVRIASALLALAPAQLAGQAPDSLTLAMIRAEGLERSQVMETLSWLTDVYGGRLTSSPALAAAANWTERQLRNWGVPRIYREYWGPPWPGWTNEVLWVRAVLPHAFQIQAIVAPWTAGTRGVVRGPAMLVTDLSADADFLRYRGKLRNAFIMLSDPLTIPPPAFEPLASRHSPEELAAMESPDPEVDRSFRDSTQIAARARVRRLRVERHAFSRRRLEFLVKEGAAAVVNVGAGSGRTVFLSDVGVEWLDPLTPAPIPVLTFASEDYGRIARILAKGIPVTLEAEVRNSVTAPRDSSFNVLAEIPGTGRRDEVVMLGAHLDSYPFATGATDNAANVATMMEAMRILRTARVPLRRTVRLALWSGEEQGRFGSRAYVHRHFVDTASGGPRAQARLLAAYYNLDNGAGAIRGIHVDQLIQESDTTYSLFNTWTHLLSPDLGAQTVSARGAGATDHVSFYENGLPGFQFVQDWLEYFTRSHHSNADTYERVLPEDLKKNAVIVASWIYLTANHARVLPKVRVRE